MPRKNTRSRIYSRDRGGQKRFYGDFRDFSDVGGGREALIPDGDSVATTDRVIAEKLVADRLQELQERKRSKVLTGVAVERRLRAYVAEHLEAKAKAGRVTYRHLEDTEGRLRAAIAFFGAARPLNAIGTKDVREWAERLAQTPNGRGGMFSGGTVRHYLNALSNLYKRAQSEGAVAPGFNPVASLMDKPTARREEAKWLEVPDASLLLEAGRIHRPRVEDGALPHVYALLATFLLTGGRRSEVLGLTAGDISFERSKVTFRPNRWRRLKTLTSHRTIPLWPQLREILVPHVEALRPENDDALLFPSPRRGGDRMLNDVRKALDNVASEAGWAPGEIRTKQFRHSYCAARLQTLDRGHPVSVYTVSRELGHGGEAMVRRVYAHVGEVRHRSEVVEFRAEQWKKELGRRLSALRVA